LKPSNIFIDSLGTIKMIDRYSKSDDYNKVLAGNYGKKLYLSPELVNNLKN